MVTRAKKTAKRRTATKRKTKRKAKRKTTAKRATKRKTAVKHKAKRKARTRKAARKAPSKRKAASAASPSGASRVKIRMYRQGLGDFFLVTLPKQDGTEFRMLIDCGVIVGTPNAKAVMRGLVTKMKSDVGNALDIVVVTHRHADHVSGFLQAQDLFEDAGLTVGEVWVSWVEDPRDKLGKQLLATHARAERALRMSAERLQGLGAAAGDEIASLLDFLGEPLAAAAGSTTTAAVEIAKNLGKKAGSTLRFCRPADAPIRLEGTDARVFVLGPPPDLSLLGKMNPSTHDPETYGVTAMRALLRDFGPALGMGDSGAADAAMPFADSWTIALDADGAPEFFRDTYFDEAYAWQRIDSDWLQGTSALALAFDKAVNNTSLVIAIELGDGDVLLFAADAQVGNWLSWQPLSWARDDKSTVTAPDLLKRVIFYKVGHHASHNATLEAKGLEMMEKIEYAMISVDETMAHKKRWGRMPFQPLLAALDEHTDKRTVRADKSVPAAAADAVASTQDYYELTL